MCILESVMGWEGIKNASSTNFSGGQGMSGIPVTITLHPWLTERFGLYWFFVEVLSLSASLNKWNRKPESLCISHTDPACPHLSGATVFPKTIYKNSLALQGNSWSGTGQHIKCGFPNLAGETPTHFHHLLWCLCPCDQGHLPVTVPSRSCLNHCLAHVHSKIPKKIRSSTWVSQPHLRPQGSTYNFVVI